MKKELERTSKGTFKKGVSGNPKGRPRSEVTQIKKAIAKRGTEIIEQVIDRALAGDMQAAKILVDRLSPPLKAQSAPVKFEFEGSDRLSSGAQKILEATAAGKLSPDVAGNLLNALSAFIRQHEVDQLADRLEALEGKHHATS